MLSQNTRNNTPGGSGPSPQSRPAGLPAGRSTDSGGSKRAFVSSGGNPLPTAYQTGAAGGPATAQKKKRKRRFKMKPRMHEKIKKAKKSKKGQTPALKLVHIDANGMKEAQDTIMNLVNQPDLVLAVMTQPNYFQRHPNWCSDHMNQVSLFRNPLVGDFPCVVFVLAEYIVAARCGDVIVIGCCFPEIMPFQEFQFILQQLGRVVRYHSHHPIFIAGNFNAKSTLWGFELTDPKGRLLQDWSYSVGVRVIQYSGGNLTWSNRLASRITEGSAIYFHPTCFTPLPTTSVTIQFRSKRRLWIFNEHFKKFKIRSCNEEVLERELNTARSLKYNVFKFPLREAVDWLESQLFTAFGKAMKSKKRKYFKDKCYDERYRRWLTQVDMLDRDMWGRPYKFVIDGLDPYGLSLTDKVKPDALNNILDALFPKREYLPPKDIEDDLPPSDIQVTAEEMGSAISRMSSNQKFFICQGFPEWLLKHITDKLGEELRGILTICLRNGTFPHRWKLPRLYLKRKPNCPKTEPSSFKTIYRMGCLGKLLEEVIALRMLAHLNTQGNGLSPTMFGYGNGDYPVDAVVVFREMVEAATYLGQTVVAVTLDFPNAFNTISWPPILAALQNKNFPLYIRRIIEDYLRFREILYNDSDTILHQRLLTCGVSQYSSLGMLLWMITFDEAIPKLPPRCCVICHAGRVLLVAAGEDITVTLSRANLGIDVLLRSLLQIGLVVSPNKTKAVYFGRDLPPDLPSVTVSQFSVAPQPYIKYLGLYIDNKWDFKQHFSALLPAVEKLAQAFPNKIREVSRVVVFRDLYAKILHSMLLYGAPLWAQTVAQTPFLKEMLQRVQAKAARRMIRGWESIPESEALLLAQLPPIDLQAEMRQSVYFETRDRRTPEHISTCRERAENNMKKAWLERLKLDNNPFSSAVVPIFDDWMTCKHTAYSYRLTQLLSGCGCFSEHLHKARKTDSPVCKHCSEENDNAQHTLTECPAWYKFRIKIRPLARGVVPLSTVLKGMARNENTWKEVLTFSEKVMREKEKVCHDERESLKEKSREEEEKAGDMEDEEEDDDDDDDDDVDMDY